MDLWKPSHYKGYYYISVEVVAYSFGETAKPFLSNNSVKIMFKLWTASREDYERLLSLNVFATHEEAEKKLQEWRETIKENRGFFE